MDDRATKTRSTAAKAFLALIVGLCVFLGSGNYLFPRLAQKFPESFGIGNLVFLISIQSAIELHTAFHQRNAGLPRRSWLYLNIFNLMAGLCLFIYFLLSGHTLSYFINAIIFVTLAFLSFFPFMWLVRSAKRDSDITPRST